MKSFALVVLSALVTLIAGVPSAVSQSEAARAVPVNANVYRATLTKEARTAFGLDANVALMAAQIQQESAWRENAKSYVGACGLGQIMPDTAKDLADRYPGRLSATDNVCSPLWSIRGLVIYDKEIYSSIKSFNDGEMLECDRWAMTLSGYNGGPGWLNRDRVIAMRSGADPNHWWGSVENYSKRSKAAFKENRDYPRLIMKKHLPTYVYANWPGSDPCSD